jgi:orotidine-5'-phosphate decarboxylase
MGANRICARALAEMFAADRHLCVGLDTDSQRIPAGFREGSSRADRVVAFNAAIIDATADVACAYKPNLAFYEGLGADGWRALGATVSNIRERAPEAVVILDAKRGDIGSSNLGYVSALFDVLGGDAVTVHPYLGREAMAPFLERRDALIFVLARTSNPGAGEFQDLQVEGVPLFQRVARVVAGEWNEAGNCGLVVGATYPGELATLREDVPATMPFLIPGVGAQGGDLEAVVAAHVSVGSEAFLINASRSILFASGGPDFAEAAHFEASRLHAAIRSSLPAAGP